MFMRRVVYTNSIYKIIKPFGITRCLHQVLVVRVLLFLISELPLKVIVLVVPHLLICGQVTLLKITMEGVTHQLGESLRQVVAAQERE